MYELFGPRRHRTLLNRQRKFCPHPYESCIGSSRTEIVSLTTAGRQPAHRPVTQEAGAAPHDDKMPTRFVSRGLEYSLFLASEATVPGLGGGVGRKPVSPNILVMVQAPFATPPHRCSQLRSSVGRGRSRNHSQPANDLSVLLVPAGRSRRLFPAPPRERRLGGPTQHECCEGIRLPKSALVTVLSGPSRRSSRERILRPRGPRGPRPLRGTNDTNAQRGHAPGVAIRSPRPEAPG